MTQNITVRVEFSGGLELLFSNKRSHSLNIPTNVPKNNSTKVPLRDGTVDDKPADIDYLIHHLRDHLLKERVELFMENSTVCVLPSMCEDMINWRT